MLSTACLLFSIIFYALIQMPTQSVHCIPRKVRPSYGMIKYSNGLPNVSIQAVLHLRSFFDWQIRVSKNCVVMNVESDFLLNPHNETASISKVHFYSEYPTVVH